MFPSRLIQDDDQVDYYLAVFGASRTEFVEMVRSAATAKADFVSDQPLNAAGQLSYIYGTGAVRRILRPKGWQIDRTNGIEATLNPSNGIKLIFQNADTACDPMVEPHAISDKGPASVRTVDTGQGTLFPEHDLPQSTRPNTSVWYLLVHINGDDVRAELSRPRAITARQFDGFHERIFLLPPGAWSKTLVTDDDDNGPSGQDFDIVVSRK